MASRYNTTRYTRHRETRHFHWWQALNSLRFKFSTADGNSPTKPYPQQALQCYASSAIIYQKDGMIICPADRSNYCIKGSQCTLACLLWDCSKALLWQRRMGHKACTMCLPEMCCQMPLNRRGSKRLLGGESEPISSTGALMSPKPFFNRASYWSENDLCNSGERRRMIPAGFIGIPAVNAIEM